MSRLYVVRLSEESREFTGEDLPLIIGGDEDAHIPLQEQPGQAAYLAESRGHLFLQPASSGIAVFHNDVRLSTSVWVKSGDVIAIGPERIHLRVGRDRVDILMDMENLQDRPAAELAPPEATAAATFPKKPLPRVTAPPTGGKRGRTMYLLIGLALLLLSLSALFVVRATSIDIRFTPLPDRMSVDGFPPVLAIGDRLLALEGTYTVRAARSGYRDFEAAISVDPSTVPAYAFTMEKLPGRVSILTEPAEGVAVLVDNQSLGSTPLASVEVAAGSHRLSLRKERYLEVDTEIEVVGMGEEQEMVFTLQPAWAEVSLSSEPAGAAVLAGGEPVGQTPLVLELLQGEHSLVLRKEDFAEHSLAVTVEAGVAQSLGPVVLSPATARVSLATRPAKAALTVDGVFRGRTPLELELSPNIEHTFALSLPGYASVEQTAAFPPNESAVLTITLEAVYGTIFVVSEPVDAKLAVNGKHHGRATGKLRLQADRAHELTFSSEGYEQVRRVITPRAGYSQQLDIRLQRQGQAKAQGSPASASIAEKQLFVPPVTLQMGASRSQPGRRANEAQRTVRLTRPVYLGKTEVTNREFRRFKSGHRSGMAGGLSLDSDGQPAVNLSWEEAARYCNWLSKQEGLPLFYQASGETMVPAEPFNTGYRLPSEAEWAYAARQAGRSKPGKYPWEGTFPPRTKSGNYGDESAAQLVPVIIRGYNDGYVVTAPVQRFPANSGGIFDMGGNVAEWCHDLYTPYSGLNRTVVADPLGPATGSHHVVRGSSWRDASITELRLSYRRYSREARDDIGFRVARYLK